MRSRWPEIEQFWRAVQVTVMFPGYRILHVTLPTAALHWCGPHVGDCGMRGSYLLAGEETIHCFLSIVVADAEAAANVSFTEFALHALVRVPYNRMLPV